MKKSILEIYALAVCFATIGCFVVTLGIALYDVIQISQPEFTLSSHEFNRHQSNDAFWNSCGQYESKEKEKKRPAEDNLPNVEWKAITKLCNRRNETPSKA